MITTAYRIIKTGTLNFFRNGWLSMASVIVMTLALLIMSTSIILTGVFSQASKMIQDKVDVSAYIIDGADEKGIVTLEQELSNNPDVKKVSFITKDEALRRYREQNAKNTQLLDAIDEGENPLPASLEVKANDPEKLASIADVFKKDQYKGLFRKVSYEENKEAIDKIGKITKTAQRIGLGLAVAFILTSLIVIFYTVKVAIYTHREEIEIMKLVGANPSFITAPFIVEGAMNGIFGTFFALIILTLALNRIISSVSSYFGGVNPDGQLLGFFVNNYGGLIFLQLLVGLLIGTTSSYVAIRKYLKKL